MNLKINIILPVLIITILFFCSGNQDEFFTIETVDGISEIHNIKPQWGSEQKIQLEFVQKIGDLDTTDDNYALFRPRDIAIDNSGNIFILDAGNFRIQKFDRNGEYLTTFGREGEGPGEFKFPTTLQIGAENQMYVYDILRSRTIILDENGNEINSIRSQNQKYRNFHLLNSGNLIVNSRGILIISDDNVSELNENPLLSILDSDLNVLVAFCLPVAFGGSINNVTMNSFNYAIDGNDNITVSFSRQNRIEKYSVTGELLWKTDRQLPYEISKPEEPVISIRDVGGGGGGGVVSIRAFGSGGGNSINTFSRAIAVDDKSRSWILSVLKQESGSEDEGNFEPAEEVLELYGEEGILLSRLPLPDINTISSFKIFGDRLFFIDRTTEMALYEYKIVEK